MEEQFTIKGVCGGGGFGNDRRAGDGLHRQHRDGGDGGLGVPDFGSGHDWYYQAPAGIHQDRAALSNARHHFLS